MLELRACAESSTAVVSLTAVLIWRQTQDSVARSADLKHSDASELRKLAEAKEQVAARMEKLENAVVAVEEEIAQLRSQLVDGPVSV